MISFTSELADGLLMSRNDVKCPVSGLDGESVIQLKTAFGGGKTHSMLALYRMMRSKSHVG